MLVWGFVRPRTPLRYTPTTFYRKAGRLFQRPAKGITVTAVHVGYMDTDMVAALDVPKIDPRDVARQTVDAILHGSFEVLADETSRSIKSALSGDVSALYPQLAKF